MRGDPFLGSPPTRERGRGLEEPRLSFPPRILAFTLSRQPCQPFFPFAGKAFPRFQERQSGLSARKALSIAWKASCGLSRVT